MKPKLLAAIFSTKISQHCVGGWAKAFSSWFDQVHTITEPERDMDIFYQYHWLNGLQENCSRFNPLTPHSDQFQISPAASPEILHHPVWRSWLFIAYSHERWLYCHFSVPHLYVSLGRRYLLNSGVKGLMATVLSGDQFLLLVRCSWYSNFVIIIVVVVVVGRF